MAPTPDLLACPNGVSAETLSALRDELLPAPEATRLRTHAASCHACQARLAHYDELRRALLAQTELEPGERIMAGVRERLAARPVRRLTPGRGMMDGRRRWSGLGALAAAAAVLLLFVDVLGTHPGRQVPIGKVTPRASVTPTATPSLSPVTDVATAWGPHAALATLTPTLGTNSFYTMAITPDGRSLLGNVERPLSPLATPTGDPPLYSAGLFDLATKGFTLIAPGSSHNQLICCQTDGHFAVGYDYDQPGATCGVCHIRYWAYDLSTGQMREVASGYTYQGINQAMLSEGILVLGAGTGIVAVNLQTGDAIPLAGTGPEGQSLLEAFAWPYLVYADRGSGALALVHLRDLRSGTDMALHQLDNIAPDFSMQVTMALEPGTDTLFAAVGSGGGSEIGNGTPTLTTLYELDDALTPGAPMRVIGRYGGDLGELLGANGRLVLFQDGAWDRAEGRFVVPNLRGMAGFSSFALAGTYFVAGFGPGPVTIYDTSRLLVRTGT